jgi:hypothetical protein
MINTIQISQAFAIAQQISSITQNVRLSESFNTISIKSILFSCLFRTSANIPALSDADVSFFEASTNPIPTPGNLFTNLGTLTQDKEIAVHFGSENPVFVQFQDFEITNNQFYIIANQSLYASPAVAGTGIITMVIEYDIPERYKRRNR